MSKFLIALQKAEQVLQEAMNLILKFEGKTAGQDKDCAQHLISVIKSVLVLLDRYKTPEIQGYKPHDISTIKISLEKLQTKLEAL
jgi:hypothetical protein